MPDTVRDDLVTDGAAAGQSFHSTALKLGCHLLVLFRILGDGNSPPSPFPRRFV